MKRLTVCLLMVVVLLAAAGPASAGPVRRRLLREELRREASATGSPVRILTGIGSVTAQGRGHARFLGSGTITVSGTGSLKYKDLAGDAKVSTSGRGRRHQHIKTGVVHYHGYKGSATISGSKILVRVIGFGISLTAEGKGVLTLRGRGTYTVSGQTSNWTGKEMQI